LSTIDTVMGGRYLWNRGYIRPR